MLHGILPVNKPENISSAQVVARVKRCLGLKKAGHTGTLDPFATGLVLVALGKATRISKFFLDGNKDYLATVRLGIETDTYDKTGKIVSQADPAMTGSLSEDDIVRAVARFKGVQEQVAPSFSALKHQGQPLYKLARQGRMIVKPPRTIEVFDIQVTRTALPEFDVHVRCSSGTYIRSLAYDMGKKLGCGAHLSGLVRTMSSAFRLEDAVDMDLIHAGNAQDLQEHIISMSDCLSFLPAVTAGPDLQKRIGFGQPLPAAEIESLPLVKGDGDKPDSGLVRVVDETNILLAIIQLDKTGSTYIYSCVFTG